MRKNMKAYIITESFIRNIVVSSTADERTKHLFHSAVVGGQPLLRLVYNTMCYQMPAYQDLSVINPSHEQEILISDSFKRIQSKYGRTSVVRSLDPLDSLYNRSFPGGTTVFDSYVLDELYKNMEDMIGIEQTQIWFEEVLELFEYVVLTIESYFITLNDDNTEIKLLFKDNGNNITVLVQ